MQMNWIVAQFLLVGNWYLVTLLGVATIWSSDKLRLCNGITRCAWIGFSFSSFAVTMFGNMFQKDFFPAERIPVIRVPEETCQILSVGVTNVKCRPPRPRKWNRRHMKRRIIYHKNDQMRTSSGSDRVPLSSQFNLDTSIDQRSEPRS